MNFFSSFVAAVTPRIEDKMGVSTSVARGIAEYIFQGGYSGGGEENTGVKGQEMMDDGGVEWGLRQVMIFLDKSGGKVREDLALSDGEYEALRALLSEERETIQSSILGLTTGSGSPDGGEMNCTLEPGGGSQSLFGESDTTHVERGADGGGEEIDRTLKELLEGPSENGTKFGENTYGGQLVLSIIGTDTGQPIFIYEGSRKVHDGDPHLIISLLSSLLSLHLGAIGESNVEKTKITISNTGDERYFWVMNYSRERKVFVAMLFSTEKGVFDSFFMQLAAKILHHRDIPDMVRTVSIGLYPQLPEGINQLIEQELSRQVEGGHQLHLQVQEIHNGVLRTEGEVDITLSSSLSGHPEHDVLLRRAEIFLPATAFIFFRDVPHGYMRLDSGVIELVEPSPLPQSSELRLKLSTKGVDEVPRPVTINVGYECVTCGWVTTRPVHFFIHGEERPILEIALPEGRVVTYHNGHAEFSAEITLQTYSPVNRKNFHVQWVNLVGLEFTEPRIELVTLLKSGADTDFIFPGRYKLLARFTHDSKECGKEKTSYRGTLMFSLLSPQRMTAQEDVDIVFQNNSPTPYEFISDLVEGQILSQAEIQTLLMFPTEGESTFSATGLPLSSEPQLFRPTGVGHCELERGYYVDPPVGDTGNLRPAVTTLSDRLIAALKDRKTILLKGGAARGKTTMSRIICHRLWREEGRLALIVRSTEDLELVDRMMRSLREKHVRTVVLVEDIHRHDSDRFFMYLFSLLSSVGDDLLCIVTTRMLRPVENEEKERNYSNCRSVLSEKVVTFHGLGMSPRDYASTLIQKFIEVNRLRGVRGDRIIEVHSDDLVTLGIDLTSALEAVRTTDYSVSFTEIISQDREQRSRRIARYVAEYKLKRDFEIQFEDREQREKATAVFCLLIFPSTKEVGMTYREIRHCLELVSEGVENYLIPVLQVRVTELRETLDQLVSRGMLTEERGHYRIPHSSIAEVYLISLKYALRDGSGKFEHIQSLFSGGAEEMERAAYLSSSSLLAKAPGEYISDVFQGIGINSSNVHHVLQSCLLHSVHVGLLVKELYRGSFDGVQEIVRSSLRRSDASQVADLLRIMSLKYGLTWRDLEDLHEEIFDSMMTSELVHVTYLLNFLLNSGVVWEDIAQYHEMIFNSTHSSDIRQVTFLLKILTELGAKWDDLRGHQHLLFSSLERSEASSTLEFLALLHRQFGLTWKDIERHHEKVFSSLRYSEISSVSEFLLSLHRLFGVTKSDLGPHHHEIFNSFDHTNAWDVPHILKVLHEIGFTWKEISPLHDKILNSMKYSSPKWVEDILIAFSDYAPPWEELEPYHTMIFDSMSSSGKDQAMEFLRIVLLFETTWDDLRPVHTFILSLLQTQDTKEVIALLRLFQKLGVRWQDIEKYSESVLHTSDNPEKVAELLDILQQTGLTWEHLRREQEKVFSLLEKQSTWGTAKLLESLQRLGLKWDELGSCQDLVLNSFQDSEVWETSRLLESLQRLGLKWDELRSCQDLILNSFRDSEVWETSRLLESLRQFGLTWNDLKIAHEHIFSHLEDLNSREVTQLLDAISKYEPTWQDLKAWHMGILSSLHESRLDILEKFRGFR